MRSLAPRLFWPAVLVLWVSVVLAGFDRLHRYESTPGPGGVVPGRWPGSRSVAFDRGRFNAVLFAHPRCPCTGATVENFLEVAKRHAGTATFRVAFFRPGPNDPDWGESALHRLARTGRSVRVLDDEMGDVARRFGVRISGHLVIYDRDGRLVFSGGLTGGRGVSGRSPGVDLASAILSGLGPTGGVARTPVFGCPLDDDVDSGRTVSDGTRGEGAVADVVDRRPRGGAFREADVGAGRAD